MSKKRGFLIFVTALSLFLGFGGWRNFSTFHSDEFDAVTWNSTPTDDMDCYRGGMAGDVSERILSVGMAEETVVNLLGLPYRVVGDKYEYPLGSCSLTGSDMDSLYIKIVDKKLVSSKISH